jgi:hypothetical protein
LLPNSGKDNWRSEMTADDFNRAILERLRREPFKPFIVELLDGEQVEIDRPRSLAIRGGTAGGFGRNRKIIRLDSYNVARVFDVLPTVQNAAES